MNKDLVAMNLKPLNLLCNNKDAYNTFTEYMDVLIEQQHRKLEQTADTQEMFQSQGAIQQLRSLKYLRERVNDEN
jgi:Ribonuclease G/E